MTPAPDTRDQLDVQARRLHAAALAQLSPQTLSRLRAGRHAAQAEAPPSHAGHWRWLTASVLTAVMAVGIGVQFLPTSQAPRVDGQTAVPLATQAPTAHDDYGLSTALDEDPDLYLWLASADAQPLAMESTP